MFFRAKLVLFALHTVSLTWNPSQTPNVTYQVFRETSPGACAFSDTQRPACSLVLNTANTNAQDFVAPGTYYYVVRAMDSLGNLSVFSNEAQALVRPAAPVVNNPVVQP